MGPLHKKKLYSVTQRKIKVIEFRSPCMFLFHNFPDISCLPLRRCSCGFYFFTHSTDWFPRSSVCDWIILERLVTPSVVSERGESGLCHSYLPLHYCFGILRTAVVSSLIKMKKIINRDLNETREWYHIGDKGDRFHLFEELGIAPVQTEDELLLFLWVWENSSLIYGLPREKTCSSFSFEIWLDETFKAAVNSIGV